MKGIQYKHKAKIINQKIIFEDRDFWLLKLQILENKNIHLIIEEEKKEKSQNLLGYYFGVIIDKYCLKSNAFAGWTKDEVNSYFLSHLRTHLTVKNKIPFNMTDRLSDYNNKDLYYFVEDVRNFLAREFNIITKDPEKFKINEFKK